MTDKILGQGAEAIIYLTKEKTVKKVRIKKGYRVNEIDSSIIKSRTKREKKILERLPVSHPKLISYDENTIEMEYIEGDVLKNVFDVKYCKKLGEMIAEMHDADIVHGDLTTSNMILQKENITFIDTQSQKDSDTSKKNEIFFIDFGLSLFSKKIEDKAVDLHLLYRALESKHYKEFESAFKEVLEGYKKSPNYEEVMERFKVVESRGRNKH